MKVKETIISLLMLLGVMTAQAQINIAGNVYGGGIQLHRHRQALWR